MNEIAMARGIPQYLRIEVGQWKRSVIRTIRPQDPLAKGGKHIANRYCTQAAEVYAARMIADQITAVRSLLQTTRMESIPFENSWDVFSTYKVNRKQIRNMKDLSDQAIQSAIAQKNTDGYVSPSESSSSEDEANELP